MGRPKPQIEDIFGAASTPAWPYSNTEAHHFTSVSASSPIRSTCNDFIRNHIFAARRAFPNNVNISALHWGLVHHAGGVLGREGFTVVDAHILRQTHNSANFREHLDLHGQNSCSLNIAIGIYDNEAQVWFYYEARMGTGGDGVYITIACVKKARTRHSMIHFPMTAVGNASTTRGRHFKAQDSAPSTEGLVVCKCAIFFARTAPPRKLQTPARVSSSV